MTKKYDIVLYGASSYVSKYIISILETSNLKVALAARDVTRIHPSNLEKIACEIKDIDRITKQTLILINCAGPYDKICEPVIASCVRNKTHYLDLCGETGVIREIITKHDDEAALQKVFIVPASGFDSVIADLGTEILKQEFDSNIEIESIVQFKNCTINTGTWNSLVNSFHNFKKSQPSSEYCFTMKTKEIVYDASTQAYLAKFRNVDAFIVSRTQIISYKCNMPVCRYKEMLRLGSLFNACLYAIYFFFFVLFSKCRFGKNMLMKYPKFFSCGIAMKNPTNELIKKGEFIMHFKGTGIKNDRKITKELEIAGPDPAYTTTAICICQCAFVLHDMLLRRDQGDFIINLPGGVVTPGFLFLQTDLADRLKENGISIKDKSK